MIRFIEKTGTKPRADTDELRKQVEFLSLSEEEKQVVISEFNQLEANVTVAPAGERPVVHSLYCQDFNSIDKFDGRAYDYYGRDNVKRQNWNLACAMALDSYALVNASSWIETNMMTEEDIELTGNGLITPRDFMIVFYKPLFEGFAPTELNPNYKAPEKKSKQGKTRKK